MDYTGFLLGIGVIALFCVLGLLVLLLKKQQTVSQAVVPPPESQIKPEALLAGFTANIESLLKATASQVLQSQSQDLLKTAQEVFGKQTELNKKDLESLVKPLNESVLNYKKSLEEVEAKRNKEYGGLDGLIRAVLESNEKLGRETLQLSNALKRPTVRGRWGEIQLRRIVELAGMIQNVDFEEQTSVDSEEGRLRPDMIVRLPGDRRIVVDSKATLGAYLDSEGAADETTRKAHLVRHAQSVKARVVELSRKNYWEQFKSAPEFVVLFIPGEMFLSAALIEDPGLLEDAFKNRVVIATPSTLMALLRAVSFGWRQEALAENARKIGEEASRLYQALTVWTSHLGTVGGSLERATKAFNASVGSLERTVLPPARRMKELGVSGKDELAEVKPVELSPRLFEEPAAT